MTKDKTKNKYSDSQKKWRKENKDRVKKVSKVWRDKNKEKVEESRAKFRFGGNVQEVLERDNFRCQDCGMTQEQHIIIFGTRLNIHHIDGKGKDAKIKNNKIDNLICLCHDCHARLHKKLKKQEKWGKLLEQDDSEWTYPKLRKLVNSKVNKETNITESKKIVAEEIGVSFWTIDGYYYEKKSEEEE